MVHVVRGVFTLMFLAPTKDYEKFSFLLPRGIHHVTWTFTRGGYWPDGRPVCPRVVFAYTIDMCRTTHGSSGSPPELPREWWHVINALRHGSPTQAALHAKNVRSELLPSRSTLRDAWHVPLVNSGTFCGRADGVLTTVLD